MIEIKNLNKRYGEKIVLNDLNLELHKPDIYALVGPNGTGKTTLMDIMANFVKRDSGEVKICNMDPSDFNIFKKLSYARNLNMLYDNLTGLDHLELAKSLMNVSDSDFKEAIEIFGVSDFMKKKVSTYSLGMRQKMLLTYFFIGDYDIYVMDEPVTGLDPSSIILLREYLHYLKSRGKMVILSSHTLSEVDKTTDEILFLVNGKILRENLNSFAVENYLLKTNVNLDYEKRNDSYFIPHDKLDTALKEIFSKNGNVYSVEKYLRSTEDRYKELYG
ncbi:ABC transporter ATP-binding protein [Lagierella massiliensis]|uniref:ABC transporter ATP-binding protein n=1 Tax=Lagierella massiliensis TaxID=1689303 RepID=UPI0006D7D343|nr:ABC transporter ATP-binding protein [Lagierella massiliensis]